MRILLVALIIGFFSLNAKADPVISLGAGKGILRGILGQGVPFERSFALGYEHVFPVGVFVRPEVGVFFDISGNGKSSIWAAPMLGVRALSKFGPQLHLAVGPGYLQNPDQVLGGHFQFSLEGGIGMEDDNFYIGTVWKHLSSAGIYEPNKGRDFIMVQLRMLKL